MDFKRILPSAEDIKNNYLLWIIRSVITVVFAWLILPIEFRHFLLLGFFVALSGIIVYITKESKAQSLIRFLVLSIGFILLIFKHGFVRNDNIFLLYTEEPSYWKNHLIENDELGYSIVVVSDPIRKFFFKNVYQKSFFRKELFVIEQADFLSKKYLQIPIKKLEGFNELGKVDDGETVVVCRNESVIQELMGEEPDIFAPADVALAYTESVSIDIFLNFKTKTGDPLWEAIQVQHNTVNKDLLSYTAALSLLFKNISEGRFDIAVHLLEELLPKAPSRSERVRLLSLVSRIYEINLHGNLGGLYKLKAALEVYDELEGIKIDEIQENPFLEWSILSTWEILASFGNEYADKIRYLASLTNDNKVDQEAFDVLSELNTPPIYLSSGKYSSAELENALNLLSEINDKYHNHDNQLLEDTFLSASPLELKQFLFQGQDDVSIGVLMYRGQQFLNFISPYLSESLLLPISSGRTLNEIRTKRQTCSHIAGSCHAMMDLLSNKNDHHIDILYHELQSAIKSCKLTQELLDFELGWKSEEDYTGAFLESTRASYEGKIVKMDLNKIITMDSLISPDPLPLQFLSDCRKEAPVEHEYQEWLYCHLVYDDSLVNYPELCFWKQGGNSSSDPVYSLFRARINYAEDREDFALEILDKLSQTFGVSVNSLVFGRRNERYLVSKFLVKAKPQDILNAADNELINTLMFENAPYLKILSTGQEFKPSGQESFSFYKLSSSYLLSDSIQSEDKSWVRLFGTSDVYSAGDSCYVFFVEDVVD